MSNQADLRTAFLRELEETEAQNAALSRYGFVDPVTLANSLNINSQTLNDILLSLQGDRLIIWDKNAGVRSRIGHILFCLYNSETRSRQTVYRNVSDLKYIRYVKRTPKYSINLDDYDTSNQLNAIIEFKELEAQCGPIITSALEALSTHHGQISQFQFNATTEILRKLKGRTSGDGLVLVADTGAGKSFAYQLPLLLWILQRKIRAYLSHQNHVACTSLLVFPRNVLAQDQLENLNRLAQIVKERLDRLLIPSDFKELLSFRIRKDFGGTSREHMLETYERNTDIIVTNTETLKRRLMNPLAHKIYREGLDLVLYDEVHLYYGLHGAFVAGLNSRLKALLPRTPLFVGMSATIAKPDKHCQKLFALSEKPIVHTDRNDELENRVVEHHVILKPRPGRPPLGVAVDTTACLLHNRRDGAAFARSQSPSSRPKSICFSDSLDTTGRWTSDLNDVEFFEPVQVPRVKFKRGYPFYFRPGRADYGQACVDCGLGKDPICSVCEFYSKGSCWWFSQDSGDAGQWETIGSGLYIPRDGIRSKRLTSQEVDFERNEGIYDLFKDTVYSNMGRFPAEVGKADVDNLVATSVLEVGVDFKGIEEIVMFGEIQSPASYKQRCGRGAREGNVTNGLFVMTVVPPKPLASFYYRHFHRLVNPTLVPVPLEPANPDSVKSHAFGCVLDFIAASGLNIFDVFEVRQNEQEIEEEFRAALGMLTNQREAVATHVRKVLSNLGVSDEDTVRTAIDRVVQLLGDVNEEIEIDGERKSFVSWIFLGSRDAHVLRSLYERVQAELEYVSSFERARTRFRSAKETLEGICRQLKGSYAGVSERLNQFTQEG